MGEFFLWTFLTAVFTALCFGSAFGLAALGQIGRYYEDSGSARMRSEDILGR